MVEVKINAAVRPSTSRSYKRSLREQGKIPAIIYGKDIAGQSIEVDARALESVIRKKGRNALIDLAVKGKQGDNKYVVMLKEIQRDPLSMEMVHADLCKISLKDKIHASVPVVLRGDAKGVRNGGVIQAGLYQVDIESLPADIPEVIAVDISQLDIGDHLTVADLPDNGSYKIQNEPEAVIATVLAPRMTEPEPDAVPGPVVAPMETKAKETGTEGEAKEGE